MKISAGARAGGGIAVHASKHLNDNLYQYSGKMNLKENNTRRKAGLNGVQVKNDLEKGVPIQTQLLQTGCMRFMHWR